MAKTALAEGGFFTRISEDLFNGVPIQEFGVPARFRLKIAWKDLSSAAHFLASKMNQRQRGIINRGI